MTLTVDADALADWLVASRIAGEVDTSREENLRNLRRCLERQDGYDFGLTFSRQWSWADALAAVVERVGISPDEDHAGPDTIDPRLTLAALDRLRELLMRAARDRSRVLLATGHPAGVMAVHVPVAAALRTAGCTVLRPAAGWAYRSLGKHREVRWVTDVGTLSDRGGLVHTHSPRPMRAMLDALAAAGEAPPDLVVADHGWTGAAAEAGVPAVGYADCNDPALFLGEAEGKVAVAVPLDDNVPPHLYGPVTAYLLQGWASP